MIGRGVLGEGGEFAIHEEKEREKPGHEGAGNKDRPASGSDGESRVAMLANQRQGIFPVR